MTIDSFCIHCGRGISETYSIGLSHVQDLLYHNNPPVEQRVNFVRIPLQKIQRDVQRVDQEILRMRAELDGLIAKREALHNYAEAHKGAISPLRRLPVEILSAIFVECLPHFPSPLSNLDAPLLTQRVCRMWKDVTRSTPKLWSFINLSLLSPWMDSELAMTSTCLARSGCHPLSIALGMHVYPEAWMNNVHTPAVNLLLTQSERWLDLHLHVSENVLDDIVVAQGKLPLLQNLVVKMVHYRGHSLGAFKVALMLRSFIWQEHHLHAARPLPRLPWDGLTKLVMRTPHDAKEIWHILHMCPNLVECDCEINDAAPHKRDDVSQVKLPHLRSLAMVIPTSSDILSTLMLPVLEHARFAVHPSGRYNGHDKQIPWPLRSGLSSLLFQSGSSVKSFKMRITDFWSHDAFTASDVLRCLEAVPSLTEFELWDRSLMILTASMPLNKLTDDKEIRLVPKLDTLILHDLDEFYSDESFSEFLRFQRMIGDHPTAQLMQLERITIVKHIYEYMEDEMPETMDAIRVLESQGVHVTVVDSAARSDWW